MIPAAFDYKKPADLDEALSLLKDFGDDAKLLAGGQSLLPAMKLRFNSPGLLIDIRGLEELKQIKVADGFLHVGAGVTHGELAASEAAQKHAPALAYSASIIGDVQVRNLGTLGGALAHADPAADYPAVVVALDGVVTTKGPDGEREIEASDFFQELFMTALEPEEILTGVKFPLPCEQTSSSYVKFANPASRYAVVGCAVKLRNDDGTCRDVRVSFNGVANAAFRDEGVERALEGKVGNTDNVAAAAQHAAADAEINSDPTADEDYRKHLAHVYARRALTAALGL